jgi:hypothetical protein
VAIGRGGRSAQRRGGLIDRKAGKISKLAFAAPLEPRFLARLLDQDSPHGFGGGKEMSPSVPLLLVLGTHQPQVRLMHERRGLERLAGLLLGQPRGSQFAQLVIDEWQKLLCGPQCATISRSTNSLLLTTLQPRRYNTPVTR